MNTSSPNTESTFDAMQVFTEINTVHRLLAIQLKDIQDCSYSDASASETTRPILGEINISGQQELNKNCNTLVEWLEAASVYEKNRLAHLQAISEEGMLQRISLANQYPQGLRALFFLYSSSKDPNAAKGRFDAGREFTLRTEIRTGIEEIRNAFDAFYSRYMQENPEITISLSGEDCYPDTPERFLNENLQEHLNNTDTANTFPSEPTDASGPNITDSDSTATSDDSSNRGDSGRGPSTDNEDKAFIDNSRALHLIPR